MNYIKALQEFHHEIFKRTGFWQADTGQKFIPNNATAQLRARLHDEEVCEIEAVLYGNDEDCSKAHLLKEICDGVYVLLGTAVIYGLPFEEAFARTHSNNLAKLATGHLEDGKWIKAKNHPKVDLRDLTGE